MGRSWLKFFACGHTATANDASSDEELLPVQEKASSDKRKWSFRKRSSSHKVINSTVTSDPASVEYNKSPENAVENLHAPRNSPVPEKVAIDEPLSLSPTVISESVDPLVTCSDSSIASRSAEDSAAVVIQTAVRGYFARRELLKLKNVVKLQAAMRGHLVRRHAIGSLRCIHAIIKMQTLVRARQAGKCVRDSDAKDDKLETDSSVNGYSIEQDKTCPSKDKLFLNRFARQFLECTPKTTQIPIKCDPSRSDSAWKWFERWMTVISPDRRQQQEQNSHQVYCREEEITELSANGVQTESAVTVVSFSSDLELPVGEAACQAEGEEVINNSSVFEFQPAEPVFNDDSLRSLAKSHQNQPSTAAEPLGMPPGSTCYTESLGDNASSISCQASMQSNGTAESACVSVSDEFESLGKSKRAYRRTKSGPARSVGKSDVSSSRNPPSPVFVALQNKFEVLSSGNSVDRSKSVAYLDGTTLLVDSSVKELNFEDISVDDPVQVETSECRMDFSVARLLESPDKYEAGEGIVLEVGSLGNNSSAVADSSDNASNSINKNLEKEDLSIECRVLEHERLVEGDECLTNLIPAEDASQVDHQLEKPTPSDTRSQMDISKDPVEHGEYLINSILAEDASQEHEQLEELTASDMQSRREISVDPVEDDECLTSLVLSADASPVDHQLKELTTADMQGQMEFSTDPVGGDECLNNSVLIEDALQVDHQLEELISSNSGPSTSQMEISVDTAEDDECLRNSIPSTDASQVDHQQELTTFDMPSQMEISVEPRPYMSSPDRPPESQTTVGNSHVIEFETLVEGGQIDILVDPQVYKSSPERTFRSRKTVMECHQLSANTDNLPSRKQRLQLLSKSSPSTPINNPGGRSGAGDFHSSSQSGRRRNSFGMAKSDHIIGEARLSSSDSIPSYMRATESTKAKFHSNSSPRSSSDVQDKESYLKKRQSFPIADVKYESSPRMQRSSSQKQQARKGKATHSPHGSAEKRWQR